MRLRLVWGSVLFAAVLALPNVSLETIPPPPDSGSIPLAVDSTTDLWQSEPIDLEATAVGLSWGDQPAPRHAWVRASENGIDWGAWVALETGPDHAPDGTEATGANPGTDPVFVGEARQVQFRVEGAAGGLEAEYVETAGRNLNVLQKVRHFFKRIRFFHSNPVQAQPDQPQMVSRSEWGGDACLGGAQPERTRVNRVQMLFVHHTSTSAAANSYTREQAMKRIYAICAYHVDVRGWDDIGYNYLIDRFGTVYEGRGGGYGVQGAHTKGFNAYSAGIAFLGYYQDVPPTPEAQQALTALGSWILDVAHVDPLGTVTVTSNGSSRWEEGTEVTFSTIAGHRDAGLTSCPGNANYSLLGAYRQSIAANPDPKIYGGWPTRDPVPGFPDTGYEPASFDFRFTEPMTWVFSITDETGLEMLRAEGSGTEGSVTWDGTFEGVTQPVATYRADLQAFPTSGAQAPRPAAFDFRLGSFNPPFSDDDESVFEPDIDSIFAAGITKGCGPDLYCPDALVTRGQMALFLTRLWTMSNYDLPPDTDMGFVDISDTSPEMQAAINQLAELGVTAGIAPDRYGPADPVTRWQMALFLTRLWADAGYALPVAFTTPFTDIGMFPPDVQTAINDLTALGITGGTGPGTYDPSGLVTRGQMAAFLARTMNGLGWGPVVS
ncbi:N-acetylmuramoyl-L-alanine amidase [bacterium BMS3Bbin01]|nr:N-acetylmuramoyl-L-alanine amidase [bacterium BMS3Bbin01]